MNKKTKITYLVLPIVGLILLAACNTLQPLITQTPEEKSSSGKPALTTKTPLVANLPTSTPASRQLSEDDQNTFEQNRLLGRGITFIISDEEGQTNGFGALPETRYFEAIKQAGFNSINLPIDWSVFTETDPPYQIDPEGFEYVDEIIDRIMGLDMPVVLYFGGDQALQDLPRLHKDRFLSMWDQVADHYKGYPENLYFGLYFNPQGTLGTTSWNEFANLAITQIRKTNPGRTILVQTGTFNATTMVGFTLPEDDRGLIVSFFYFSPFQFTFQGMEFGGPNDEETDPIAWTASEEEVKLLQDTMETVKKYSGSSGRPANLVAFGCTEGADAVSRNLWISSVAREAEENDFSWGYLAFFMQPFSSAYDIEADAWDQNILQALIP